MNLRHFSLVRGMVVPVPIRSALQGAFRDDESHRPACPEPGQRCYA